MGGGGSGFTRGDKGQAFGCVEAKFAELGFGTVGGRKVYARQEICSDFKPFSLSFRGIGNVGLNLLVQTIFSARSIFPKPLAVNAFLELSQTQTQPQTKPELQTLENLYLGKFWGVWCCPDAPKPFARSSLS